jgi:hypothetical protein
MKQLTFLILLSFATLSCNGSAEKTDDNKKDEHAGHDHNHDHKHSVAEDKGDGIHYGLKKITADGAVQSADIIAKLEKGDKLEEITLEEDVKVKGLKSKVEGTIVEMCKMSGCWFTFKTAEGKILHVQMREHKPTPKEWAGKTVIVEGEAYKEVKSIEELRHAAKADGLSREEIAKINSPETSYNFIAEGAIQKK